jgi:hypothetical protein
MIIKKKKKKKRVICCLRTPLEQAKFIEYFGLNSCYFPLELDKKSSQFEPTCLLLITRHNLITSSNALWFYYIQAVAELIYTACRNAYKPSSYMAINEVIMVFKG